MRVLLILLALLAPVAQAAELHVLSLDEFTFDAYRIANNRDPYYPYKDPGQDGEYWSKGAAVIWNVDLLKYGAYDFYWRNRVEGDETNVQFREVYWAFEGGLEYKDYCQMYYAHKSEHLLDASSKEGRFPLHNMYGVRVTFYKRDRQ